jgi:phosphatidylglycerophosphatase C
MDQSPVQRPSAVAAFDVDGTLTWTDSFVLFLRFVTSPLGYGVRMARAVPGLVPYGLGLAGRDRAKAAVVAAFLRGMPHGAYLDNCAAFAERAYPQIARADGLARLAAHAGVGQAPVFVSASLADYLKPWADKLGVAQVLATELEVRGGVLTGRLAGPNCWGPQKAARLAAAFPGVPVAAAYGDSRGDRELLELADGPDFRSFVDEPRERAAAMRELWWGDALGRAPWPVRQGQASG